MMPSFSSPLGSSKKDDDNKDHSSQSLLSKIAKPHIPHTPKLPNVTQILDATHVSESISSVTQRLPELNQASEVASEAASEVISTVSSFFNKKKNDGITISQVTNTLSPSISPLPGVTHLSESISTTDLPLNASTKVHEKISQAQGLLSSVKSQLPQLPEVPTASQVVSTAASLSNTNKLNDNIQSLLVACPKPELPRPLETSKEFQKPQGYQTSEWVSSATSQVPDIPKVVPSISSPLGAVDKNNNTQSLLSAFPNPQLSQVPDLPQIPQVLPVPQIPQVLPVPQIPQFPDVITSSTPLLGSSAIPKEQIFSFLRQILTQYLSSRIQQKTVIWLVVLDLVRSLVGITINFLESLSGGYLKDFSFIFEGIRSLLGMMGFMISNAFVIEQVISMWTFGWRNYLKNPYNGIDSFVTFITFVSSLLPNTINEFASLLVVLRLWRLFKRVRSIIPNLNPTRLLPNSYV